MGSTEGCEFGKVRQEQTVVQVPLRDNNGERAPFL
jgi:hypothetical protein